MLRSPTTNFSGRGLTKNWITRHQVLINSVSRVRALKFNLAVNRTLQYTLAVVVAFMNAGFRCFVVAFTKERHIYIKSFKK